MDATQHRHHWRAERALPPELWQEVFRCCCVADAILSAEAAPRLDNSRTARTPYDISAVCALWRTIALETAELWTFIHVCIRSQTSDQAVLAMVQTNIHRSVDQALQLLVYVAAEECYDQQVLHRAESWLGGLYDNLGMVLHRWRRCYIQLSGSLIGRLNILRKPTPVLKELILMPFHGHRAGPLPVDCDLWHRYPHLAHAPQLHRLESHCVCLLPLAPLKRLEYLSYSLRHDSVGDGPVWLALAKTPALRELHIYFPTPEDHEEYDHLLGKDILLPALETLGVYGIPGQALSFELVKMPRLRTLLVSNDACDMLGNLFGAVSGEVRHVVITSVEEMQTGFLSAHTIEGLSSLISVETLELRGLGSGIFGDHGAFFSSLAIYLPSVTRIFISHCRLHLDDCGPIAKLVDQNLESSSSQYKISFKHTTVLWDSKKPPEWYASLAQIFAEAIMVDVQDFC